MKNPFSVILAVAAIFLFFTGKIGFFVPAIILFFVFNNINKANKNKQQGQNPRGTTRGRGRGYDPRQRQRDQEARRQQYEQQRRRPSPPPRTRRKPVPKRAKPNPYKNSGVAKYKDFDYNGAIEDFKKAIEINSNDIPTHFNLACAYSLTEQKDLAYKHLDYAVKLGFKDLEKIKTHDAFAYIRIQKDFEAFEKNGFQLEKKMDVSEEEGQLDPQFLERLRKLAELRDRGILTEEEFLIQKEKLIR